MVLPYLLGFRQWALGLECMKHLTDKAWGLGRQPQASSLGVSGHRILQPASCNQKKK